MATRIAIGVEYDGSRFLGWQTQPGGGTVQDALESALGAIAGGTVALTCAGRTDRGVHALEQVAHFDAPVPRPLQAWVRGVNALLPDSVAVLWAHAASSEFHARYSAHSRLYRYVLIERPVRPALAARFAGWSHLPLDEALMQQAADALRGEHDFSAFRAAECQAKSPLRTLREIRIERRGERIDFVLRADAFLQHMVRNIVGTLVYVGQRRQSPGWARALLESRDRTLAAPTFAAEGLYLESVEYEARWGLPQGLRRAITLPLES